MTHRFTRRAGRVASTFALAVVLSACGTTNTNYVTGESQRGAYTWAQERQIGAEADQQIVAQFGVYDDAELSAYVNGIAQSTLQTSAYSAPTTPAEIRNSPFTFRVLDSPVVNAFALPGGYVYLTRGLLAYLENEAQLSVVLGHEIGHVLARHSSSQAQRAQLGQLGVVGAAILGGVIGGGRVAEGIAQYGGTGAQLLLLRYGRDAEREADQAGVAYAEFAGYDASQASRFFRSLQRLGAESGQSVPNFLSTHPDPGEREQTILQLAAQTNTGTAVEAAPYLRQIDGIVLGEDPRQGFTEGSTFYHPELRFRFDFPTGWNVQNTPQAVQIAEPNGRGALQMTLVQQTSAQAAAQAFAAQQGLQVSDSRSTSINGNRSAVVEGSATTQQGTLQFTAAFIEYGGNVYQLIGIAPQASYAQVRGALQQSIQSFERLTESRYLNRQPSRLDVITTSRSASIQSLLSGRTLPGGVTAEDVAIMNQVNLGDPIPSGTAVKLPQ
jgi:predicted Zn-dependent protease